VRAARGSLILRDDGMGGSCFADACQRGGKGDAVQAVIVLHWRIFASEMNRSGTAVIGQGGGHTPKFN